jgi:hypothetical protein
MQRYTVADQQYPTIEHCSNSAASAMADAQDIAAIAHYPANQLIVDLHLFQR